MYESHDRVAREREGDFVEFAHAGAPVKGEFECTSCGYAVTVSSELPRSRPSPTPASRSVAGAGSSRPQAWVQCRRGRRRWRNAPPPAISSAEELDGEGLAVVRHHHERWDGQGYPDTLAEAAIPLGARIFAVADALDAITSRRPYRPARSWDEAIAEIDAGAGRQFDPTIVEAFRRHERSLRRLHHQLVAA